MVNEGNEPDSEPRKPARRRVLDAVLVSPALIQPLASLLSGFDWAADLISHFQEPAFFVTLAAFFWVLLRRRPRLAAALGVLAAVQVVPLLRYEGENPVAPDPGTRDRLRFLMANVFVANERYGDLEQMIRRERPQVVGLVEYTTAWQEGLERIRREYPYRIEAPAGPKGLALWFREPPLTMDLPESPLPDAWPVLHATVSFAGRPRDLWLVHPHSPIRWSARKAGNPELAAIADLVGRVRGSRIVMGDMNTTDGSANFSAFLRKTELRDSRFGFGRQGSFPTFFPYRIAIDHALVSSDLAVVERRVGPPIGSDHLPLLFELAPASSARNAPTQASQASSD